MPYHIATLPIETAIRTILAADVTLTGLLASKPSTLGGGPAIYNDGEVPQGATMPYLTIGAWTQIGFHSMGSGYGWNCTGQIKAVGQRTEDPLLTVMSRVFALLEHGQALTVTGYTQSWTDEFTLQATIKEVLAGVTTFHVPAILRVYVS